MKTITAIILMVLSTLALADTSVTVHDLQKRWAEIKYQLPEKEQEKALEELIKEADASVAAHPDSAEFLTWQGIIHATYAGVHGGLGALGEVKTAKKAFEHAIEIDPQALSGSAYTSLGSLYYQVPGWPIGFGSSKKARKFLLKGLALNPDGIDSNFFYGDYLMSEDEYDKALTSFEKALQAPSRQGRELADKGRKQEVMAAIEKIKEHKD